MSTFCEALKPYQKGDLDTTAQICTEFLVIELFAYSKVDSPDKVTDKLKRYADQWREVKE